MASLPSRSPLAKTKLAALDSWTTEALHELIEATAAELGQGMGKVGMPLRVAVTGLGQSPAIDAVMALVGKGARTGAYRPRTGLHRSPHGCRVSAADVADEGITPLCHILNSKKSETTGFGFFFMASAQAEKSLG